MVKRAFTVDGKKVRRLRLVKKHWRQEDLAQATGLQPGTISRIETDYHEPQLGTVGKLADALGVDFDDLVTWHIDDPFV